MHSGFFSFTPRPNSTSAHPSAPPTVFLSASKNSENLKRKYDKQVKAKVSLLLAIQDNFNKIKMVLNNVSISEDQGAAENPQYVIIVAREFLDYLQNLNSNEPIYIGTTIDETGFQINDPLTGNITNIYNRFAIFIERLIENYLIWSKSNAPPSPPAGPYTREGAAPTIPIGEANILKRLIEFKDKLRRGIVTHINIRYRELLETASILPYRHGRSFGQVRPFQTRTNDYVVRNQSIEDSTYNKDQLNTIIDIFFDSCNDPSVGDITIVKIEEEIERIHETIYRVMEVIDKSMLSLVPPLVNDIVPPDPRLKPRSLTTTEKCHGATLYLSYKVTALINACMTTLEHINKISNTTRVESSAEEKVDLDDVPMHKVVVDRLKKKSAKQLYDMSLIIMVYGIKYVDISIFIDLFKDKINKWPALFTKTLAGTEWANRYYELLETKSKNSKKKKQYNIAENSALLIASGKALLKAREIALTTLKDSLGIPDFAFAHTTERSQRPSSSLSYDERETIEDRSVRRRKAELRPLQTSRGLGAEDMDEVDPSIEADGVYEINTFALYTVTPDNYNQQLIMSRLDRVFTTILMASINKLKDDNLRYLKEIKNSYRWARGYFGTFAGLQDMLIGAQVDTVKTLGWSPDTKFAADSVSSNFPNITMTEDSAIYYLKISRVFNGTTYEYNVRYVTANASDVFDNTLKRKVIKFKKKTRKGAKKTKKRKAAKKTKKENVLKNTKNLNS